MEPRAYWKTICQSEIDEATKWIKNLEDQLALTSSITLQAQLKDEIAFWTTRKKIAEKELEHANRT